MAAVCYGLLCDKGCPCFHFILATKVLSFACSSSWNPCISARFLTMVRPIPVPCLPLRLLLPLTNGFQSSGVEYLTTGIYPLCILWEKFWVFSDRIRQRSRQILNERCVNRLCLWQIAPVGHVLSCGFQ